MSQRHHVPLHIPILSLWHSSMEGEEAWCTSGSMWLKAGIIQMLRVNSELRDYLWTESRRVSPCKHRQCHAVSYTAVLTRLEWRGIMALGCVAVYTSVRKFCPGVIAASDGKVSDPYVARLTIVICCIVRSLQILFALCLGRLCCFQGMEIVNSEWAKNILSFFTHFGAWKRLFACKPSVLIIPLFCCFITIPAVCKSN